MGNENRSLLSFNNKKLKHILLLPGLIAPVQSLFPLVKYLRQNQEEFGVTAIPLRLSISNFDLIVKRATNIINKNLLQKISPKIIILFGHSHGGRVASELVKRLKIISPSTEYSVITAGTSMIMKPNYLSPLHRTFFNLSKSYRNWNKIQQPNINILKKYIGYYSSNDSIVIPKFARTGHRGKLIKLQKFSHHDFISPSKMGPILLRLLKKLG